MAKSSHDVCVGRVIWVLSPPHQESVSWAELCGAGTRMGSFLLMQLGAERAREVSQIRAPWEKIKIQMLTESRTKTENKGGRAQDGGQCKTKSGRRKKDPSL